MAKHLIVFEGPAGAGKSTLIKTLIDQDLLKSNDYAWQFKPAGLRDFGEQGPALSMLKDINQLILCMSNQQQITWLDRCYASQLVYEAIRVPSKQKDIVNMTRWAMLTFVNLLDALHSDYLWRQYHHGTFVSPWVAHFIFLVPPLEVIQERRASAGREFPFDLKLERDLYSDVFSGIINTHRVRAAWVKSTAEAQSYLFQVHREERLSE